MKHHHYILYKPYNYLSQFVNNQNRRRNKKLLGELGDFAEGTMSIGRLDEKSEGLLLLTTDGRISEQVRSKHIEKEYYVEVEGEIAASAIEQLQKGVEIPLKRKSYLTLPCVVKALNGPPRIAVNPGKRRSDGHGPTSWISITITEGKFRQIRKMTAVVGHPTVRLIRVRIGEITLTGLIPGEVRKTNSLNV